MTKFRCWNGPLAGEMISGIPDGLGVVKRIGSDAYVATGRVDDDGTPIVTFMYD